MVSNPVAYTEARNGRGGVGGNDFASMAGSDMLTPWHSFMSCTSAFILITDTGPVSTVTALWNGSSSSQATEGDWLIGFPSYDNPPVVILQLLNGDVATGDYYYPDDVTQSSANVLAFDATDTAMPVATRAGFSLACLVIGAHVDFNMTAERIAKLFEGSATV